MTWQPVPKNPQRRSYVDPIVVVGNHNKAYFSLVAEEKMGSPDELVFLNRNGRRAVRPARDGDATILRRKLDPNHSVTVPKSLLEPGHYLLRIDGDGLFQLIPTLAGKQLTARTRRAR